MDTYNLKKQQSGLGIAGMILGIVAVLLSCICIGGLLGAIGFVLSIIGITQKNKSSGTAIAGIALNSVAILAALIFFILSFGSNLQKENNTQTKQTENNTKENATEYNEETSNDDETEDLYLSIGDEGILDVWSIHVTDTKTAESIPTSNYTAYTADEGNEFFIVYLTVANNGKKASSFLPRVKLYNSVSVKLIYQNEYEYSSSDLLVHDDNLHDTFLNPLASKSGIIAFKLPDSIVSSDGELILKFSAGMNELLFKVR